MQVVFEEQYYSCLTVDYRLSLMLGSFVWYYILFDLEALVCYYQHTYRYTVQHPVCIVLDTAP